MKGIHKITLFFLATLLLVACSRKKDTFVSRNFHAVTGEFNSLYNGQVAFDTGMQGLAQTYNDNFWQILPVERIEIKDNIVLPGEKPEDPNFNRAEEKAVKSIQKHSMYIDGRERNPQTDEAYLLLGKARYFDERFIPALDAFNFILNRYPTSNNINKANVWKAKTNIRLNNEEVAIESLKKMLKKSEIDEEDIADASAMIAQAYLKMDSIPQALPYIKDAAALVKNNELKGRYLYIKGQLYNTLHKKDSANLAFDEVIALNRRTPRRYMINAHLAKARNFNYEKEDKTLFLELLTDLEKNRENRPYLDKIYYQTAEYYRNIKSIDTAIIFYNKSLKKVQEDKVLRSFNYNTLAEINFDRALYKDAGAYYDSTLTQLDEKTRKYRRIKKKRENLEDVIKYEEIAIVNDSILRFVAMTEAEKLAYFKDYTKKLKEKAIADSTAAVKLASKNGGGIQDNIFANNKQETKTSGPFYFYNQSTVSYGIQEFEKTWGKRQLTDNWRLSSSNKNGFNNEEEETQEEGVAVSAGERFDPQTYIAQIPTDLKVIDSLSKDRNFAYYQLGLIYKEKFKEYELAANRLETLLTNKPEERLILPAKYNLYKIYGILEKPTLETKYKNDILSNHSDSRYAEILRNPNTQLATDASSPEYKYNELFRKFEAQKYQEVIDTADEYITTYNGNDIVPKLEILKATAIGKQQGFEAYKKALNYVSLNYPNNDEGKQAQKIYSSTLPKLEKKEFSTTQEGEKKFKLVYAFQANELQEAEALKTQLEEIVAKTGYGYIVSTDYYNPDTQFIIIHGLQSLLGAKGFGDILRDEEIQKEKYNITKPFFAISSDNYKIIQIHKNMEEYLESQTEKVE